MKILPTPEPTTATGPIVDLSDAAAQERLKHKFATLHPTITHYLDSARAGLNRRSARKKNRNRKLDALSRLIQDILETHPGASWKDVLVWLERDKGHGVVCSCDNGRIEWENDAGKIRDIRFDAVEDRVTRIRARRLDARSRLSADPPP